MIVSIRGTTGSGKSTVVRRLMAMGAPRPIFGAYGLSHPEAYSLTLPGVASPVAVVGSYMSFGFCGCDAVRDFSLLVRLLEKYMSWEHCVFEGLVVGKMWGRVGAMLERRACGVVCLFLTTPPELCVEWVRARRLSAGGTEDLDPHYLLKNHREVERVRERVLELGTIRLLDVGADEAPNLILDILQEDR